MAARVAFRGGWTCSCVAESLPWVEQDMKMRGIIQNNIDIAQLGWRGDVGASAGTHDEGGCTDTWGQYQPAAIDVWRLWGWTMQRRDLTGVNTHAHGWPYGCTHLAPAAQRQNTEWNNRQDGLVGSGRVVGRWPVKHWKTALDEGVQRMYTLDDIAEAVLKKDGIIPNVLDMPGGGDFVSLASAVAGIGRRLRDLPPPSPAVIADAVLSRDGKIENPDGTSTNEHIALATAFKVLYDRQEQEAAATKAQIDALSAKLDALTEPPA